jgi:putative redox protein
MRTVTARLATADGLATDVQIGPHLLRADEPADKGGTATGPAPTEMLLAALGACEAITLRMYAARKGWPLRNAEITLTASTVEGAYVIRRRLTLEGDLTAEQRARLHEIADRCPVQRAITGEVRVEDTLAEPAGNAG